MAVSKIKITFPQNLIIGSTVSFNFKQVSTGIETPVTFTWVASRANPYEVTLLTPVFQRVGLASANAFKASFEIDQPDYPIEVLVSRNSSSVVITSNDDDITFSGGTSTYQTGQSSLVTFQITRDVGIIFSGISSDNYFINNETWVGVSVVEVATFFSLTLRNINNGKTTKPFIISANNSSANFNISPILKSLFDDPEFRNQNLFEINVSAYSGTTQIHSATIIKNFIRGGNRTELTNQNIATGSILRPTEKLPIWDGFPTNEFYLDNDGSIQIRPFAEVDTASKDFKRVKGCNNIYFKFLNQQGGYSNWLFESYNNVETNANLGAYVKNNTISDLGNEVDNSLSVYSKVPSEYYPLIQDLFISPEIYVWKDLRWVRVLSGKNTSDQDTAKRAYSVKARFIFENRFNPSRLWSN